MSHPVRATNSLLWSVTATSAEVLGPNPRRVMLILFPASANRYSLGLGQAAVIDQGITQGVGYGPTYIRREEIGDDICQAINVIGNLALTAGVLEVVVG